MGVVVYRASGPRAVSRSGGYEELRRQVRVTLLALSEQAKTGVASYHSGSDSPANLLIKWRKGTFMADEDATTEETGDATSTAAVKPRSKHGVPRVGLEVIDQQAQKIWVAARRSEVAPEVVARALSGREDTKASGGGWRARLTPLKLFKVVAVSKEGKIRLTELGVALANTADVEGRAAALKTAALNIAAYETILRRYDGGELPALTPIKSEFEFGWEMSAADASTVAELFVAGAKYAGLVGDDGVVRLDGAHPATEADEAEAEDEGGTADTVDDDSVIEQHEAEFAPPTREQTPDLPRFTPAPAPAPAQSITPAAPTGAPPVALNVKLDMSGWDADDVLRVLAALGYEGTASAES